MNLRWLSTLAFLAPLALAACDSKPAPAAPNAPAAAAKLEPAALGKIERLNRFGEILLASQPAPDDFRAAKSEGVKSVINLRHEAEIKDFDEPKLLGELGLAYQNVPFGKPEELTDEVFDSARKDLAAAPKPVLLHCHSANRVGAIWLAYRALDGGIPLEAALAEAKTVGLTSPALEKKAADYVERQRAKTR